MTISLSRLFIILLSLFILSWLFVGSIRAQTLVPGDCNGDSSINAGDLSAVGLEIVDGDNNYFPEQAPGGTFAGTPACDANGNGIIDAADVECTNLLMFHDEGACSNQVLYSPGDCNGDGAVDAADLSALPLEIADGDSSEAVFAPGGSFKGTIDCDANKDGYINTADSACINLILFNGPRACATLSATPTLGPGQLAGVNIHATSFTAIAEGGPIGLSALAYDGNKNPLWAGVTYEWGISSTNSVGSVLPLYGTITNFTPLNQGNANVFVVARQGTRSEQAGVELLVNPKTSGSCIFIGDGDCSGVVDLKDLASLLAAFGKSDSRYDFNRSGGVDLSDLTGLLSNFGKSATSAKSNFFKLF